MVTGRGSARAGGRRTRPRVRSSHRDGDVVEDREVLHILAQPDAAGVRAYRHAELRRHQQHRQDLVDAAEPATTWQNSIGRAWRNCLNITRFWQCSPVATPIPRGRTASATLACPSTSSGLSLDHSPASRCGRLSIGAGRARWWRRWRAEGWVCGYWAKARKGHAAPAVRAAAWRRGRTAVPRFRDRDRPTAAQP